MDNPHASAELIEESRPKAKTREIPQQRGSTSRASRGQTHDAPAWWNEFVRTIGVSLKCSDSVLRGQREGSRLGLMLWPQLAVCSRWQFLTREKRRDSVERLILRMRKMRPPLIPHAVKNVLLVDRHSERE